jgi:nicotinamide mononucleotide transporter
VLATETHAAWPYLDSFSTWVSLLATWMVTQLKLENWLYWIAADAIMAWLFAAQGYSATAMLFLIYVVIAVFGFREWLTQYRQAPA